VRSTAAVYVPRFQLVFLNIWLSHERGKIATLQSLDRSLRAALGTRPVDRVMVAMDSNDFRGNELVGKSFSLLGKMLQNSGEPCHTCAEVCDFNGVGDFIFDSGPAQTTLAFGVPSFPFGWTKHTQLMSDHLPVMAAKVVDVLEPMNHDPKREREAAIGPLVWVEERVRSAVPRVERVDIVDVTNGHTVEGFEDGSGRALDPGGLELQLTVVSAAFEGMTLLARQRLVFSAFAPELSSGKIHALPRMKALTPLQWQTQLALGVL